MNQKRAQNTKMKMLSKSWLLAAMSMSLWLPPQTGNTDQAYFPSADAAANTLVIAAAQSDQAKLNALLGEAYTELLPIEQIDPPLKERFFQAWAGFHALIPTSVNTRMLAVGEGGWTFPIPIVREAQGWRFDTEAGAELMHIRRIGRNELSAMQAALAYHDAQMEYATQDRDGDGVLEFAQTFISTPGEKDGLYWAVEPGEAQSPLGPLFAAGTPDGAYYGYHYRILNAQGENARGGARSYLVDGQMRTGFGLIAWPVEYGSSGVMSFMLSRDGILYEADLGPSGDQTSMGISSFDPDARWSPVLAEYTEISD